jgi:hypothetical protein
MVKSTLYTTAKVLPGNRIEIQAPNLIVGQTVEVVRSPLLRLDCLSLIQLFTIFCNMQSFFETRLIEKQFIMRTSVQEIYTQTVRNLPPTERLRLAKLILNELVDQPSSAIEESETWTEQDQNDLLNFSLQYATTALSDAK